MLSAPTIDKLYALNLGGMAHALTEQREQPAAYGGLGFEDRLGMLVDREATDRENRRLERYLRAAKLRLAASVEDVDFRAARGLDRGSFLELAASRWVDAHQQVLIVGPTGVGKTYLACALATAAIRAGHSALYLRTPRALTELATARLDGRLPRLLVAWAKVEVLVLDDFGLQPLTDAQAADLLEVIEDRAGRRSTIVTSQLPIAHWHEGLGEPTVADAILDRLLHAAHRLELRGESRRRSDPSSMPIVEAAPDGR
jgi:DNA replication protein DnaC